MDSDNNPTTDLVPYIEYKSELTSADFRRIENFFGLSRLLGLNLEECVPDTADPIITEPVEPDLAVVSHCHQQVCGERSPIRKKVKKLSNLQKKARRMADVKRRGAEPKRDTRRQVGPRKRSMYTSDPVTAIPLAAIQTGASKRDVKTKKSSAVGVGANRDVGIGAKVGVDKKRGRSATIQRK